MMDFKEKLKVNGKLRRWLLIVSAALAVAIITALGARWQRHFIVCDATAQTSEETKKIVEPLQEAVLFLTQIQKDEDAATLRDAELCGSGELKDCKICARAGAPLDRCSE